ncbi:MAG: hypothetical protein OXG35_22135 [Acidobacteria bacterium]|nr:hypothetical protein [Acidobacteriota bacterium]
MPAPERGNRVGLCLHCRHARAVRSRTDQDYYRCGRSDDDGRYSKYPRLPMLSCDGYEPGVPDHPHRPTGRR